MHDKNNASFLENESIPCFCNKEIPILIFDDDDIDWDEKSEDDESLFENHLSKSLTIKSLVDEFEEVAFVFNAFDSLYKKYESSRSLELEKRNDIAEHDGIASQEGVEVTFDEFSNNPLADKDNLPPIEHENISCFESCFKELPNLFNDDDNNNDFWSCKDEMEDDSFDPFILTKSSTIKSLVDEIEEVAFVLGDEYFEDYLPRQHSNRSLGSKSSSINDECDIALKEGIELILVEFSNDESTTSKHAIFVVGYQSNDSTISNKDEVSWGNGADAVSRCIVAGANLFKNIIDNKIESVSDEIETTGEVLIETIHAEGKSNEEEDNNEVGEANILQEFTNEFIIYTTNSLKHGAEKLRTNTMNVALGMRDIATHQIIELVDTMEEAEVGKVLVPNEENREMLAGLGKVVLTAAGAAGISFDVMVSSTETGKYYIL